MKGPLVSRLRKYFILALIALPGTAVCSPFDDGSHSSRDSARQQQILVIDSAVPDSQHLLQGVAPETEIIQLQATGNALAQLAEALHGRSGIDSLHLVTHGGPGSLQLGRQTLNEENLSDYEAELATIGAALNPQGDILLYGCRVAKGELGRAFIGRLSLMTGADLAASDDATGSIATGGDWVLERRSGNIESTIAITTAQRESYGHQLATFDFEGAAGSLTTTVTTTVSGVTLTVTDPYSTFWVGDGGGYAGTSGTVLVGGRQTTNLTTFSFSSPIDLTSFRFANQGTVINYTFTPTGGSGNSAVNATSSSSGADIILNWNGITSFTVTENGDDGIFTDTVFDTFVFSGANASPVLGGTTAGQTVNDNATSTLFSGVTISDADGDNVTTTVTLDDNAKGVFTGASLSASGFSGSGPYTLAATTPANAQTAIRQLIFDPTDDRVTPGSTETTTFTLLVSDGSASDSDNTTTVIATSINDAPAITSNGGGASAATAINENTTAVTTVTISDPDTGDSHGYTITGGADAASFNINPSSGVLTFASAPDFEAPTDSGSNNVYDVQVTVTDNDSATDTQDLAVTIGNINENPVIISDGGGASAAVNAAEGQTAVTTVTAVDPDSGDSLSYTLTGGADAASFSINPSSGVLTFTSAPDFESPTDSGSNNVYDVQVTVTDNGAGNLTDVQDIAVSVTNANEAPVITSNGGGASAATAINENTTAVTTVTVSDPDSGDSHGFAISGGADAASFSINPTSGVLVFTSAPDFESPADSGSNNVYDVQVTVTDDGAGNLTDVQDIAVSVTNANEAPAITSNGGGASAAINAAEGQTVVTTVAATDPDSGDSLNYTLTGGADAARFSINPSSGVLVFTSAPDFEAPADSGANNVYDVQVTVTDDGVGNLTDTQSIAVSVNDSNEAPSLSGNPSPTAESDSFFSFTPSASDPDAGASLSFSISTTPSWASFNGATGELSGTPVQGDVGSFTNNIIISVTDGSLSDTLPAFSLTVIQGNQPPVIGGSPATSVTGHTPYSFVPTASDADSDPLSFTITNKPAWAVFNPANGALSGTPTNNDVGTTTGVEIRVSDGLASATLSFDLTVNENTDIDGDGMPNDWELANGLDPNDPNDALSDLDGDGINNLNEYLAASDPASDDNPPTLDLPGDITLNAVGLFTPVNVGTATAYDVLDGVLAPSSDARNYYPPGSHRVTWSVSDAAGNRTSAVQTVNIIPQVSFSKDQSTSEGSSVSFRVILNGEAVAYPVSVPYVVAGSSAVDGSDHDLSDGTAVIASGLETSVSFSTVDDGPGEGTEEILIAMDTPGNAVPGPQSLLSIRLLEGNVAPQVNLGAEQNGSQVRIPVIGNGAVTVTPTLIDPNSGDSHSYDWSATDSRLSDIDTVTATYTFDPSTLSPGLYTLSLRVSDGQETDTATLSLNLIAAVPSLSASLDSDGDGISDAAEGIADGDNDGVADYLDAIDSAHVLQEQSALSESYLIESEPSVRLLLGNLALQSGDGEANLELDSVESYFGAPAGAAYDFSGGLFDFVIEEIPIAGQSVQVVVAQLVAIPQNPVYRKIDSEGWRDFVVNSRNGLASAAGEPGYCPPPGDNTYSDGLTPGHWCVQLTIEDGGPNDADGSVNHAIEDPGGVAERHSTQVNVSLSGGGGASGLLFLLLLMAPALSAVNSLRKRRQP